MSRAPRGDDLRTIGLGGLVAVLAAPATALAGDMPSIEWSGAIFAHYGYLLGDEAEGYNEFDIDRVYLTAESKLSDDLAVRVTTDVGRARAQGIDTDGDGAEDIEIPEDEKIRVFLKNAYLEWGVANEVKLRFGAAGTAFIGTYDRFWGHRYLAKSFTDDNGILDSADIGVHALGAHADGMFTWQGALINGDGYDSAEVSATKAVQARATFDPMASGANRLPLTVFVSQDVLSAGGEDDPDPVTLIAGAAGYSMDFLTLWGEYVMQHQGEVKGAGYSATLMPTIPDVLYVIARYDHWDPDSEVEADAHTTLRGGISRDFFKGVSGSFTYERTTTEADPDVPGHGLFVRMQAGF